MRNSLDTEKGIYETIDWKAFEDLPFLLWYMPVIIISRKIMNPNKKYNTNAFIQMNVELSLDFVFVPLKIYSKFLM